MQEHDKLQNSRNGPSTQVTPICMVWVARNGFKSAGANPKVQSVAGAQKLWNALTKIVESLGIQSEINQGGQEPIPTV